MDAGNASGSAYVFVAEGPDCNENGTPDCIDIAGGGSEDVNGNGVPDECECLGDVDGSGVIDLEDLLLVLGAWGPCPGCPEDVDGDGNVGFADVLALLIGWGPCA